ncbi:DMT family transporter [Candidatus Woesearchaeota archaeon]|nr:DMT family transporter [Candidatus Woesearchaeota archaeon]
MGLGFLKAGIGTPSSPGRVDHFAVLAMFIVTILLHLFEVKTKFSTPHGYRIIMYLLVAIAIIAFLFRYVMDLPRAVEIALIVSAVAFFLPWLFAFTEGALYGVLSKVSLSYLLDLETISWLMILFPVWPWVIAIMFFNDSPTLMRWGIIAYFIALLLIFVYLSFSSTPLFQDSLSLDQFQVSKEDAKAAAKGAVGSLIDTFTGVFRSFKTATQYQIKYATGDYYTGDVDKNKDEPLGVYLEKVEPASPFFYKDEAVTVWGTLKARTIDQDTPLGIKVTCDGLTGDMTKGNPSADPPVWPEPVKTEGKTNKYATGDAVFTKEFSVTGSEYADLTCQFDPGVFNPGSQRASFQAVFNFDTNSYLKSYFMDQEYLRGMRQQGADPFMQFQIKDTSPRAVYSNGPIEIGMTVHQPLQGIIRDTEFRLSGSLKNRWEGKILGITKLVLKVPPGMEVKIEECNINLEKKYCSASDSSNPDCTDGSGEVKYDFVYNLKETSETSITTETAGGDGFSDGVTTITTNVVRRGIEHLKGEYIQGNDHVPFACNVKVTNPDLVLGGVPLSTQYFKVSVGYEYELEKATSITIKDQTLRGVPGAPGASP